MLRKKVVNPAKFVMLGGDAQLVQKYLVAAKALGFELDHFEGMHDLGYLGRFREYRAAIVHDELQPLSGLELAEYLEKLFHSLPMILLMREPEVILPQLLPSSIVGTMLVDTPAEQALMQLLGVLELPMANQVLGRAEI